MFEVSLDTATNISVNFEFSLFPIPRFTGIVSKPCLHDIEILWSLLGPS